MTKTFISRALALLMVLISVMAGGAETLKDDCVVSVEVGIVDQLMNYPISIVLDGRKSKEIFSDRDAAEAYLDSLVGSQDEYEPVEFKAKSQVTSSDEHGMPVFHFKKGNSEQKTAIIYLPGGAFARQPLEQHFEYADEICRKTGCDVFLAVYPKTPTYDYKYAHGKLYELYTDILSQDKDIILAGDSSGASIAITFTEYLNEKGVETPTQLILYSPFLDLSCSNPEMKNIEKVDHNLGVDGLRVFSQSWVGSESIEESKGNPINCDLSKMPKITIFTGTYDVCNPDVYVFTAIANEAGADITVYEYEQMYHVFVLLPQFSALHCKKVTYKLISEN